MAELDVKYPGYGLATHKGYPTPQHVQALKDKGVLPIHRRSFGPVREVEKAMVLEIAFDSIHESARHKSGVAMRFPRIARIRTDKPAAEADRVETLKRLVT